MARAKAAFKPSLSDRLFDLVNYTFMTLVMIVTLYPFLHVLAISLNDSVDAVRGGIHIWPREFTLENYAQLLQYESLLAGAKISVLRTVTGTFLGLLSGTMLGYVLSRTDFQGRKFMSVFLALTMYFSGGLIPVFILIRDLNMMNSFLVYIIPGMVSAFNVFVIRSYIDGLPYSLQESAKLDGAGDFMIYYKIIVPLCKPVLATIALFVAVGQWNSWFDTYLYNGQSPHLTTLQFELMKVLQNTQSQTGSLGSGQNIAEVVKQVSPESIRMAITMVVTVPILLVYPFLQRYFVKGMTLGAVKS